MRSISLRTRIYAIALIVVVSAFREATAGSEAEVTARAQRFFDDYNRAILLRDGTFDESVAWVAKNPLVTSEYKRALAKAYRFVRQNGDWLSTGQAAFGRSLRGSAGKVIRCRTHQAYDWRLAKPTTRLSLFRGWNMEDGA